MLGRDDSALVERDRAIAGLALLLEPDRLLAALAGQGGLTGGVRGITTTYLRYKPGISLTAGLRLYTVDGPLFGYAVAYGEDSEAKLAKATCYRHELGGAEADLFGVLADCGVVVGSARLDRELPGVAHLTAAAAASSELRPLRYKPARRWVASDGPADSPRSVLKVHRPGTVARLAGVQRALHVTGAPVGELLDVDDRRGVVRTRWVTGQSLEAGLHGPGAAWSAGHSLARLHRTPARTLPGRGAEYLGEAPDDLTGWLARAVNGIEAIAPDLSGRARDIAGRALAALPADRPTCVVHGDFSADQVIVRPEAAVIVDLDRARLGDPAVDIANYAAAELGARSMADGHRRWTYPDVLAGLLDGYRAGGGWPVAEALPAVTAAALLATATEPFRLGEPAWTRRMSALLDAAAHAVQRR